MVDFDKLRNIITKGFSFINLLDAPSSYKNKAGEYCRVNSSETALEFSPVNGGGMTEGNYISWTKQWGQEIPNGIGEWYTYTFYIDHMNDILYLWWENNGTPRKKVQFAAWNLPNGSTIFESDPTTDYLASSPDGEWQGRSIFPGQVPLEDYAGISRSFSTYLSFLCWDKNEVEVWRNGSSIWSRDVAQDVIIHNRTGIWAYPGFQSISQDGEWIVISFPSSATWNGSALLVCYKGT